LQIKRKETAAEDALRRPKKKGAYMKILSFLNKYLEEALCGVVLSIMTVVIFMQIVFRGTGLPLSWTEEVGRYLFIWLIYLGSASAVKKRKHISLELLDLFLKKRGRFVLSIISNAVFLIFALILTWNSVPVVLRVVTQVSPAMRMSMAIPYGSILVGFALMAFRLIQDTVARFRERREELNANV